LKFFYSLPLFISIFFPHSPFLITISVPEAERWLRPNLGYETGA